MLAAIGQNEDRCLRRAIAPGAPIGYWRLGALVETRFDVADVPMQGEMDPFFFLTAHKNFIPHEYPCRTEFAARHRGRRPEPQGSFVPEDWFVPFGSPRLDMSGFWYRPTRLSRWVGSVIVAETAGPARFRLATCGGAVLLVNGREAGWIAPYTRNLEASAEFSVDLVAGENAIELYLDDLAERDTRFIAEFVYLDGPAAAIGLDTPVPGVLADALEDALSAMGFNRSAYCEGERVAIDLRRRLPVAARASVRVEGEAQARELMLMAGARTLAIGTADTLPAGFTLMAVTLEIGGLALSRTIGVEICKARGPAPETLEDRIAEALEIVAAEGAPDAVTALARLATGRAGDETDAMIARVLPAIEDCHDCADFQLVPLLWGLWHMGDALGDETRARAERAVLGYRYWMDEPGNDVQWYFSENHALLFHTAAYLAGAMLPEAIFVRSGRDGRAQSKIGADRVRGWLDHFERAEMAEFNSAPYFPIDLKGLAALAALAPDADIATRAGKAIGRLLLIVARSSHQGLLTGAQGRSYEHSLRAGRAVELSGIGRLAWGRGWYGRVFHALPLLALALHKQPSLLPEGLAGMACHSGQDGVEWRFCQGAGGIAKLYHYKSAGYAMGSAAGYRWGEWGYQETLLQLRIGDRPEAQIFINHPGEEIEAGNGRPSFWGGSGTIPRVQQYKGLAVLDFAIHEGQPGFTHAYFPADMFDEHAIAGGMALAACGSGRAMLKASGALELAATGPSAGMALTLEGRRARWLVRVTDEGTATDSAAMAARFGGIEAIADEAGNLVVADPEYGMVQFFADGRVAAEGRMLVPSEWTMAGEAQAFAHGD